MIVIEILDESGTNFYEILGIDPKSLVGMEDKEVSKLVRQRCSEMKREYHARTLKGDKEADEKEKRINQISEKLRKPEERAEYDKELASGRGSALEVLLVQPVSPPFFWNRNARFKTIERLMTQAGLVQPIGLE